MTVLYSLTSDGFEILPSILSQDKIEELRTALTSLEIAPGHRNLMLRIPAVASLASSTAILGRLEKSLGSGCFPVRSIFFDKTPEANWLVPWHQDLSIAVAHRHEVHGYGPWSTKDGVSHVQPPIPILEEMVTLRLHLDDCNEDNGALRVIPKSHRWGRLDATRSAEIRAHEKAAVCVLKAGDALLMRPLLLHASSAAVMPRHRRVIHLEYASRPLPDGLQWAEGGPDRPALTMP